MLGLPPGTHVLQRTPEGASARFAYWDDWDGVKDLVAHLPSDVVEVQISNCNVLEDEVQAAASRLRPGLRVRVLR